MKIGVDCRMFGLKHAGIGRYVENLVKELKKDKSKEMKFVFIKSNFPHYSLREQILLPLQLISTKGGSASGGKLKLDLVHFSHFNVPILYFGPYVVTIHDLIKHTSRGMGTTTRNPLLYWLKYLGYRFVFWNAVKRAKKILVPSKWVKKELVKQYRLNPKKVVVIYEGVGKKFKTQNSKLKTTAQNLKVLKKYKISKPFVVYTGNLYPHKNIERLIKAVKLLDVSHISYHASLAIVCARNVFWERIRRKVEELGAEKSVNLVGFVPDEDLVKVYQEAVALIQPSLMEGFDLTVVEAMAAGLPAVVSDIPVHREICGDAALYFDPKNVDDMVDKIRLILEDQSLRSGLQKLGLKQVKKYNWKKTAQQTLEVYRSLMVSN